MSFDVPINDDIICEGIEEFNLTINSSSTPKFVTVTNPHQATLTIIDNDCEHFSCIV